MVGVAVVGTGFGCLTHVRAFRAAGFDVVALVGRDPDKTAARAARFDIPNPCASLTAALQLPGVDAVTIATPPHTHAPLAFEAVESGRHVLCEKPFTRDAAEARELLAAAERAGVVHLLGNEMRFTTGQALLSRLVLDGTVGEPKLATFLLHVPMLSDPSSEVPEWWGDPAQGGGWLGAHGSHIVDQALTMFGDIVGVSASTPHVATHAWSAEDAYLVHFRTARGVTGVMQSAASDQGRLLSVTRVAGSSGTAWSEGERVFVADDQGIREAETPEDLRVAAPEPPPSDLLSTAYDRLHSFGLEFGPYIRLAEHFRARITNSPGPPGPAPATFQDGVAAMAVIDAVRQAAATAAWAEVAA
jgi:predicted dehydrogenase